MTRDRGSRAGAVLTTPKLQHGQLALVVTTSAGDGKINVYDGNRLLRTISLAWQVPRSLSSRARLGETTATLSGQNLMWWDHCACQDPYTNWAGADSFGISTAFLTDPAPRRFRLTIRSRY